MSHPHLFTPCVQRSLTIPNRIGVSPMCQYSCQEGRVGDWHLVHLGSRAVGGAGLVMAEATAVLPEGRISPGDAGLWSDDQVAGWVPVVDFLRQHGTVPGIQLAHAGRKASTDLPWRGGRPLAPGQGGWTVVGPSAVPFSESYPTPRALEASELPILVEAFCAAAERARRAGFQVVEIHMAHGYLLHEFLSPLSNRREDDYGGDLEGRMRFPLQVVEAVRRVWPAELPLWVRLSVTDWVEGGWDPDQSLVLATRLKALGVDLLDCSSGGSSLQQQIAPGPGYQVPLAARMRQSGLATATVGEILEPAQAETILATGQADMVMLGRTSLREPYWPWRAAQSLGVARPLPPQYARAFP